MIIFKKVRYKNFLSTGQQFIEINLNEAPTTLVVGNNVILVVAGIVIPELVLLLCLVLQVH